MDDTDKYIDEVLEKGKAQDKIDLNTIAKIGKVKEKVDNGFKTFLRAIWEVRLLVIIQLFSLVIIGLDKFLTATWSWAIFKDPEFWSSYLLYTIANWSVIIGWILRRFTVLKKDNQKYVANINHIQEKVNLDYDTPFIEEQANIEDTMRKVEVFKNTVYNKLYKLAVRHKIRDLDAFYRDNDNYTKELLKPFKRVKKWFKTKEYKRVYNVVLDYLEKLKKDWQKKYLASQKIDYPRVTRSHIASGLKPTGKYYKFNTYESKVFSTTLKAILPSSLTFSLIGFIVLSFQFIGKDAELSDYLLFFSQIFLIIINVVLIISILDGIFDRTYLKSTDERRTDIEKFYRRQNGGYEKYSEHEKTACDIIKYQERFIE